MDRNVILVAGIVSALLIGAGAISAAVTAHMFDGGYYQVDIQDPDFQDHYREMLDLHRQYYNGEISFEEFEHQMFSDGFHEGDLGCHGGLWMMGPNMMGW